MKPECSQLTESNFLELEAVDSEGRNNLCMLNLPNEQKARGTQA